MLAIFISCATPLATETPPNPLAVTSQIPVSTISSTADKPKPTNSTIGVKPGPKLVETVPTSYRLDVNPLYMGGGL